MAQALYAESSGDSGLPRSLADLRTLYVTSAEPSASGISLSRVGRATRLGWTRFSDAIAQPIAPECCL